MLNIGFDDNLELSRVFAQALSCNITPHHDIDYLLKCFNKNEFPALFIPAGTLPYLSNNYKILASATFGPMYLTHLKAFFCSLNENTVEALSNKKIGYINQYCTTSFWAPLIHLTKLCAPKTSLQFHASTGFQNLFDQTIQGNVDYAMIWELFLQKNQSSSSKLSTFFDEIYLPTPIIIGRPDTPQSFITKLQNYRSNDPHVMFNGFTEPKIPRLEQFLDNMRYAKEFFEIKFLEF